MTFRRRLVCLRICDEMSERQILLVQVVVLLSSVSASAFIGASSVTVTSSGSISLRSAPHCPLPDKLRHRATTSCQGSTTTPMSIIRLGSLPRCDDVSNVPGLIIKSGLIGLSSQLALYLCLRQFNQTKKSIHAGNPGYTAHSVVALVLMIVVSYIGVKGFYFPENYMATASDAVGRLLIPSSESRWLACVITGMFFAWDIPSSIWIGSLQKPDVILHHLCMLLLAFAGATVITMHYILYYFGVAELSSIPLVIYDQLQLWCNTRDKDDAESVVDSGSDGLVRLEKTRDVMGIVTAICFTWVRAYSFTKVTLTRFLPDCLAVLRTTATTALLSGNKRLLLKAIMVSSVGFTILQLYWFMTILQVAFGGKSDSENSDLGVF